MSLDSQICVPTATKEALSEMKEHKKLIEKGKPDDVAQGFRHRTVKWRKRFELHVCVCAYMYIRTCTVCTTSHEDKPLI